MPGLRGDGGQPGPSAEGQKEAGTEPGSSPKATPLKVADPHAGTRQLQRQAWQWALANRANDGTLPTGSEIACQHGRRERWGRLVKNAGLAGELGGHEPGEATVTMAPPAA